MKNALLNQSITHILLKCQLSPTMIGFDYIRDVVEKCCTNDIEFQKLVGTAYKEVAKQQKSSSDQVDKRIRAVLADAQSRKGFLAMNEYFDEVVYSGEKNLAPREAISFLVEMSKLEFAKRCNI